LPKISPAHEQKRRDQILEAAMQQFSVKGYRATSMEDIVQASGLSVGALYTYYPSKEDLFLALADRRTDDTLNYLRGLFAEPRPLEKKLTAAVHFFFDQLEEQLLPLARMSMEFWNEAARSDRLMERHCQRMDTIRLFLHGILMEGREAGLIRQDVDPAASVELMMALHDGILMHHVSGLQPLPKRQLKRAYAALINHGLATPGHQFVDFEFADDRELAASAAR
jgi:AcrR family transcriptional regulator